MDFSIFTDCVILNLIKLYLYIDSYTEYNILSYHAISSNFSVVHFQKLQKNTLKQCTSYILPICKKNMKI